MKAKAPFSDTGEKLMKRLIFILLVSTSPAIAQSNLSQRLLECSAMSNAEDRLACYDSLADDATPPSTVSSDNWNLSVDTNPVDDSQTVVLATRSAEGSTRARFGDDFSLILVCRSGELNAYINWNDYLGSDNTQVTYRIGTSPAQTDTWYLSTDSTATFFSVNAPATRSFIEKLAGADNGRLVAQVTPYNENTSTAIFDVSGLSELLEKLYESCP